MNTCAMKPCVVVKVRERRDKKSVNYISKCTMGNLVRCLPRTSCALDLIFRLIRCEQCKLRTICLCISLYLHLTLLNHFLSYVLSIRIIAHLNRMQYFYYSYITCGSKFEVFREDVYHLSASCSQNSTTKISV
jgi:hypothetical protein